MTRQEKINVKAARYLARIIKVTGALGGCCGGCCNRDDVIRYDTAKYEFWISPRQISRVDKVTRETKHTCWKTPAKAMPYKEALATVLLLLHDNPKKFEEWRRQAGITEAPGHITYRGL